MNKKTNITEITILAPVPIKRGTKSNFGEKRKYEVHPGVDIAVPVGTQVLAPMDGVVKKANFNENPLCGATIDIDYGNGYWSRFCHMSRIDVKKDDIVKQGQVVGLSGGKSGAPGSGNSGGPHLHFTLKKDGVLVDPLQYINTTVSPSKIEKIGPSKDDVGDEVSQVQDIAGKLDGDKKFDFDTFIQNLKPGELGAILTKGLTSVFTEEVKRIKELMK